MQDAVVGLECSLGRHSAVSLLAFICHSREPMHLPCIFWPIHCLIVSIFFSNEDNSISHVLSAQLLTALPPIQCRIRASYMSIDALHMKSHLQASSSVR